MIFINYFSAHGPESNGHDKWIILNWCGNIRAWWCI